MAPRKPVNISDATNDQDSKEPMKVAVRVRQKTRSRRTFSAIYNIHDR
jgi:hypothetical protein